MPPPDRVPGVTAETNQVVLILRGARRGKGDPDVGLFERLVHLDWRSSAEVEANLRDLLANENSD
jgi:hypothetical protein